MCHTLSVLDHRPVQKLRETQHMPHGTVHVSGEFGLPSDAFAAASAYRRDWPAMGYGTLLTVRQNPETQLWRVEGSRAASCD